VRFHYELLAKYESSESVDFDANELAAGMNPKRMRDKIAGEPLAELRKVRAGDQLKDG
jgi:hypothetical protein